MRQIELLAPARDYEHGRAALRCGADALYAGAPRFGARAAAGVPAGEIARLCAEAHAFGARVYVAMNTLLYDDELDDARRIAEQMWEAGADALIVQDMALLRMELPPIELHASTQTFNMEPEQLRFLVRAGFSRIILERALHLDEMRQLGCIAREEQVELEAFVHGAICVGYSGRCYLSRSMGPRSGNRGACSQSCRLPWTLLDERMQPLGGERHLLSVQDLNLTAQLEPMIDAGIGSFKIEGRLKDIAYVKNIVSWYRRQLDTIIGARDDLQRASQGESECGFDPAPEKSFTRGGSLYFLSDRQNRVASFDTPKAIGEAIGRVGRVGKEHFELQSADAAPFHNGDGICFSDTGGVLRGTNINRVEGHRIFPNRMEGIAPGTALYRNYDIRFVTAAERSRPRRTIGIRASVEISAAEAAVTFSDGVHRATAQCSGAFDPAQNPQRAEESIRTQVAKTGDTIYRVTATRIETDTPRFVPIPVLNELRREALARLTEARIAAHRRGARRPETQGVPYPSGILCGEANVTNRLSEQFYRDHGVREIEPGYDLQADLTGKRVMQTRYCLRRELGQCLKETPAYRGKLYIRNGEHRYELRFDCARCQMELLYRGKKTEGETPKPNRKKR